jgi:hypothetical protein
MTQQSRFRRPDAARTGPQRSFATTYSYPGPAASWARSANTPSSSGRIDNVIASAVDLGNRVIEEQLQQGRNVARQLRQGSRNSNAVESDIATLLQSLSRVTKSAIDAWVELLGAARGGGATPGSGLDCGAAFSIQVISMRPAQVTLNLCPISSPFVPIILELKPTTPGRKPLTNVKFVLSPSGESGALVVNVPDDLSPGVYTGEIVESVTKQFGGTISVRIDS